MSQRKQDGERSGGRDFRKTVQRRCGRASSRQGRSRNLPL